MNNERRSFLKTGLIVGAASQLWWPGQTAQAANFAAGRELRLTNMHTGEKFKGEYWQNGKYLSDAFHEIRSVMRDHRADKKFPIDPRLMDIMFVLQQRMENKRSYEVYSGYRSPQTNAKLRRMSFGVAKKSLHMLGQAVDMRLPGSSLKKMRQQAVRLNAGGVGYYPESRFVHLDTGRVRHW